MVIVQCPECNRMRNPAVEPVCSCITRLFDQGCGIAINPAPNVATAARTYLGCRRAREEAEAAAKRAREVLDAAEIYLLHSMDAAGLLAVRIEDQDGRPVNLTSSVSTHYSIAVGQLDDAGVFAWLSESGGADLVKKTIHHGTFSAFCRELAEAEKPLHQAVKLVERREIRVRQT